MLDGGFGHGEGSPFSELIEDRVGSRGIGLVRVSVQQVTEHERRGLGRRERFGEASGGSHPAIFADVPVSRMARIGRVIEIGDPFGHSTALSG